MKEFYDQPVKEKLGIGRSHTHIHDIGADVLSCWNQMVGTNRVGRCCVTGWGRGREGTRGYFFFLPGPGRLQEPCVCTLKDCLDGLAEKILRSQPGGVGTRKTWHSCCLGDANHMKVFTFGNLICKHRPKERYAGSFCVSFVLPSSGP